MKKTKCGILITAICALFAFIIWTVLLKVIDVRCIGPEGSSVGFATVNGWFRGIVGTNMFLYNLTDLLGIVPFLFVFGFAILGLVQWIKRKSLAAVDRSILVLGGFYVVVLFLYLLFETVPFNYRPVLIDGRLEVSYPSSTTLLVLTVMPTAAMQLKERIKNTVVLRGFTVSIGVFSAFMTVGRVLAGVHWITDIIGGMLLSAGCVFMYVFFVKR